MLRSTTAEVSREQAFQSKLLDQFQQGTYYTGVYPGNPKYMQVCITRVLDEKVLSFALAAVHKKTGLVLVSMIEFALETRLFENFKPQINLAPCEDKHAVERVFLDAFECHKRLKAPLPDEFEAGLKALCYTKEELADARLMLPFQHKLAQAKKAERQEANEASKTSEPPTHEAPPSAEDANNSAASTKEIDWDAIEQAFEEEHINDLSLLLRLTEIVAEALPSYDPDYCTDWDLQQWQAFIEQDHSKINGYELFQPYYLQPYLYLLKNVVLPHFKKGDPKVLEELEYIRQNPPEISQDNQHVFTHSVDPHELMLMKSVQHQMYEEMGKKKTSAFIKELEQYQEEYPQNPIFPQVLHQLYWNMNDDEGRLRQATRLYEFSTEQSLTVPIYLMEISRNQSEERIKAFFDHSVLYERHAPLETGGYSLIRYAQYYYLLANHFAMVKQMHHCDKVIEHITSIIDPSAERELYTLCNSLYAIEVFYTKKFFVDIKDNEQIRNQISTILRDIKNK